MKKSRNSTRITTLCSGAALALAALAITLRVTGGQTDAPPGYYISPTGSDSATGSSADPYRSFDAAFAAIKQGDPNAEKTIWLMDGLYEIKSSLYIDATYSGTAESPLTLRAVHPGKAILSAGVTIPKNLFQPAPDSPQKMLLQDAAKTEVRVAKLEGTPAGVTLRQAYAPFISSGPYQLTEARWPDKGYAHIDQAIDPGAVWTRGRTLGPKPESNFENPIGGTFTFHETWNGDWNKELASGISRPTVHGYFHYDWHLEKSGLASESNGTVQLVSDTRYGVGGTEKIPRRLFVRGLLCELNRPGEWFWDASDQTLYL